MRRLLQFVDVICSVGSGAPPHRSYFLSNATIADYWVAIARVKLITIMPGLNCDDPQEWTPVLREYQRLGRPENLAEVTPEGCSPEIGNLLILEVLGAAGA